MKRYQVIIPVVSILAIAAVFSTIGFRQTPNANLQDALEINTAAWNPRKLSDLEPLTMEQAKSRVGFDFKVPRFPEGYRAVAIKIEDPIETVNRFKENTSFTIQGLKIYIWNESLSEDTTDVDVVRKGGFLLTISHVPGIHSTKMYEDAFADRPRLEKLYLWGYPAIINRVDPNDPSIPPGIVAVSTVKVYNSDEQNSYKLYAMRPVEEMMPILESAIRG